MVEEFRVPTQAIGAEILLADGSQIRGEIFVAASMATHTGPEHVDEWIEEPSAFFPFLPEGQTSALVYAKAAVVALSVRIGDGDGEPLPDDTAEHRVILECAGSTHEGRVTVDLPSHQRRVLDYMNHERSFVCLVGDGQVHFVRKTAVICVREP
jgi:hypothetical protein